MSKRPGDLGEFGLIRALTGGLRPGEGIIQGIGDDCAVIEAGGAQLLLTCDASLEGVHFHRNWGAPHDLGWKAAASAISDIAAMGGRARHVLVTLALPPDAPLEFVKAFYAGVADAVEQCDAAIIGGDTTASASGIVADITVIGDVPGRAVFRQGAESGDLIAVTGVPGRRGAGLYALLHGIDAPEYIQAYLKPLPRLAEGQWLQARDEVHAMIDISDGILPDAQHIATASGVGIDLDADELPADPSLDTFWGDQDRISPEERLRSGEEYELLVALAPEEATAVCGAFEVAFGLPLTPIGRCVRDFQGVRINGEIPERAGFEHFG
ncbi:MAG: thiamine-phosphate kinase [Candidatus Hydrogenedentes bacterium]|nr:thiamine-phosphate kinase [Candidatus Hydrogenedentota bacterium]